MTVLVDSPSSKLTQSQITNLGARRYQFDTWIGTFKLGKVTAGTANLLIEDRDQDQKGLNLDGLPGSVAFLKGGVFEGYVPTAANDETHGPFKVDTNPPKLRRRQ